MTEYATQPDVLPTVSFPRLWHVGSLRMTDKGPGSLEGACLSVSRCPGAWREISDGHVGGSCWVAESGHAPFLDAHALTQEQKAAVLAWGVQEGLAEPSVLWRVSRYDDELEDTISFTMATRQEAIDEMDVDEDDEDDAERIDEELEEVHEHRSTQRLIDLSLHQREALGDSNVLDLLLPLWTWDRTDLVGVWWADRFDPACYSAPRGGVLPARIDRLKFRPSVSEPYDEDEASEEDEDTD